MFESILRDEFVACCKLYQNQKVKVIIKVPFIIMIIFRESFKIFLFFIFMKLCLILFQLNEFQKLMKASETERELARAEAVEKQLRVDDEEMAER